MASQDERFCARCGHSYAQHTKGTRSELYCRHCPCPEWLEGMTYPIISLWQPWAQWVALGWKTIETRTHHKFAGLAGKRIAIHAALKWDKSAIEAARPYLSNEQLAAHLGAYTGAEPVMMASTGAVIGARGNVICTAFVKEHRALGPADAKAALIECESVPRFGLVLEDIQIIQFIPARGKQGIWYL